MASNIDATVPADGTHPTKKSFRDNFSAAKAEIEALQASTPSTTDDLTEGATNLYYTDVRVRAAVSASGDLSYNSSTGQFSVTVPVDSVAGKTGAVTLDTDDVSEGVSNLYYTNVRARASISVSGSLLGYDSGTGVISLSGVAELAAANTFTQSQTIQSTDAGASSGPLLILDRNSASPAANDVIGNIPFRGRNSSAATIAYATIRAQILDATASSEDGIIQVFTYVAGSVSNRLNIGHGLYTPNATGGDQGADTINASGFYKDGVEIGGSLETMFDLTNGGANDLTSKTYTGISANAKLIVVMFDAMSVTGTDDVLVQLGDSGGIETTGYKGSGGLIVGTSPNSTQYTTGFGIDLGGATRTVSGRMTLELMDASTNLWACNYSLGRTDSNGVHLGGGTKALSGTLTQIKIVTSGTDTFDNGNVNISVK